MRRGASWTPLPSLKKTLRQHYDRKRAHYGYEYPNFYDRDLRRLFADSRRRRQGQPAGDALPRPDPQGRLPPRRALDRRVPVHHRPRLRGHDHRCRELNLRLAKPEDEARLEFTILLTVQTMNYLHSGRHRVAL